MFHDFLAFGYDYERDGSCLVCAFVCGFYVRYSPGYCELCFGTVGEGGSSWGPTHKGVVRVTHGRVS